MREVLAKVQVVSIRGRDSKLSLTVAHQLSTDRRRYELPSCLLRDVAPKFYPVLSSFPALVLSWRTVV